MTSEVHGSLIATSAFSVLAPILPTATFWAVGGVVMPSADMHQDQQVLHRKDGGLEPSAGGRFAKTLPKI